MAPVGAPLLAAVAGFVGRAGVDPDVPASGLGETQDQSVDLGSER